MLSIIIVNFKNPPLLRLCLKSLKNSLPADFAHEILVVDVASTIETRNITSEFPGVRSLNFKENIGYTKGVNEGIKASIGDIVFVINPDIIPLKKSIEKMTEYIKRNSEVGLIGPRLLNFDGSIQNSSFSFYGPMTIIYRRTFLGRLPWAKKELNRFLITNSNKTQTS